MSDRYAGKPFLKLLDCYVLDALGVLDEDTQVMLAKMEPFLQKTFGNGHWREVVAIQMEFPDTLPDTIRDIWEKGSARFIEANGNEPNPLEFTMQFVDTNFARFLVENDN